MKQKKKKAKIIYRKRRFLSIKLQYINSTLFPLFRNILSLFFNLNYMDRYTHTRMREDNVNVSVGIILSATLWDTYDRDRVYIADLAKILYVTYIAAFLWSCHSNTHVHLYIYIYIKRRLFFRTTYLNIMHITSSIKIIVLRVQRGKRQRLRGERKRSMQLCGSLTQCFGKGEQVDVLKYSASNRILTKIIVIFMKISCMLSDNDFYREIKNINMLWGTDKQGGWGGEEK